MLGVADAVAESNLSVEQIFDLGISGVLKFLVVVPELGACEVPAQALSHLMAGQETFSANRLREHWSGGLSGPYSIRRERLRILKEDWLRFAHQANQLLAAASEPPAVIAAASIDWSSWSGKSLVLVWQAVFLSCGIDPDDEANDYRELEHHREMAERLRLLLPALSDPALFSPQTLNIGDAKLGRVRLDEVAAWCITRSPPLSIPRPLFDIGEPLVYSRQEAWRRAAGRYTLEEAAEHLERAGERLDTMLQKLKAAALARELPMYEPGRQGRIEYGNAAGQSRRVREFYEEAYWEDLNRWLDQNEPRIAFRFPVPCASDATQPQGAIERKSPPVLAGDEAGENQGEDAGHWKMRVQAEAAAEWTRLRAVGANPTRTSIRPHLLKWCRENNVKTFIGVNPSDGYLRTHVLSSKHWTPPD
jgi:hypothetical protein